MSQTLNDKYIYSVKEIGTGAFSKVYKGFNIASDEIIAIKIVEKKNLKSNLKKRFQKEIEILKTLSHPNIIRLVDTFETDEKFYIILEYCAGGDLYALLSKGGRVKEVYAKKYIKQLSLGLSYLRNKGIVHRDLKPHNILLSKDLKVLKITDFNFARELADSDLAQTLCGSPLYMSPEIIEGSEYTSKSDLWSVGMILYEMVYGKHPYQNSMNILDLLRRIKSEKIIYSPEISHDCNNLIQNLLIKNPVNRIEWDLFFNNRWLKIEGGDPEPEQIVKVSSSKPVFQLDNYISMRNDREDESNSPPIIPEKKYNLQSVIIDEYVPPHSDSLPIINSRRRVETGIDDTSEARFSALVRGDIQSHERMKLQPNQSNPRNIIPQSLPAVSTTLTNILLDSMSASVGAVKGLVHYLSQ